MSAQRGFLSEAGSHKAFDERSAWMFIRSWFAQGDLMSAQRGCLSEAGSHKAFDERSACDDLSEAGSHKAFDERSAALSIIYPKLVRTRHLLSAQRGLFIRSWFAQGI